MAIQSTVFVVDDDQDARDSVLALIKSMGVARKAYASGEEFLRSYDSSCPGCLVTDLRMRGMSGIELHAEVAQRGWPLSVILISAYATVSTAVDAMKSGMHGVLCKPYREQELWDAVREALRSEAHRRERKTRLAQVRERFKLLNQSENEVLQCLVRGLPNKAIASKLCVSVRTIEDRRRRVMEKIEADSFAQLVAWHTELRADESQQAPQPISRLS